MLPCAAAMQEFFWQQHQLEFFAFLLMLSAAVFYCHREYLTQHEGGNTPSWMRDVEPAAHLLLVSVFMLVNFALVRFVYAQLVGHRGWQLPNLFAVMGLPLHRDYVYYFLELVAVIAVIIFARRLPGVKFQFNLRFRFKAIDILITLGFLALTFTGLYLYSNNFGNSHSQWFPFGIDPEVHGRTAFLLAGASFAVVNALQEVLWFRGVLLGSLRTLMRARYQILLQGLVFGLIHWYGTPQGVMGLLLAGSWGILLGAWTWRRRSLWPAFIVHVFADWMIFAYTAAKSGSLLAN